MRGQAENPLVRTEILTNEAKRLLKIKDITFSRRREAKRYMKTKELFLSSQEVVEAQGFIRFRTEDQRSVYQIVSG
jgi:hypothetical protein